MEDRRHPGFFSAKNNRNDRNNRNDTTDMSDKENAGERSERSERSGSEHVPDGYEGNGTHGGIGVRDGSDADSGPLRAIEVTLSTPNRLRVVSPSPPSHIDNPFSTTVRQCVSSSALLTARSSYFHGDSNERGREDVSNHWIQGTPIIVDFSIRAVMRRTRVC